MLSLIKKLLGGVDEPKKAANLARKEVTRPQIGTAYTIREGRPKPVDAAFLAWTAGDLDAMLAAVATKTNKVDRHHLLQSIVEATYKQRTDAEMRRLCAQHAALHLAEFPSIVRPLKLQCDGALPRVTTFQHYATLLTEDGEYDQAVEVCRAAIRYGLEDGTASGFDGRITRILKKRSRDDA